jgi:hypothetical protein
VYACVVDSDPSYDLLQQWGFESSCLVLTVVSSPLPPPVFSALFAKTYRINKLMESSTTFARVQVEVKDVMGVFSLIMFCNVLVLTLWTVLDPLMYTRSWDDGTDFWNREFSSSGSCSCDRAGAYLGVLGVSKLLYVWATFLIHRELRSLISCELLVLSPWLIS